MRTRICLYILLLAPLAAYWQTAFYDFGITTDYANLRASHEQPGQLVKESAGRGRPLYGAMLETSFSAVGSVDQLRWLRLVTVLLLTLLGVVIWRQLYNSGWNEIEAACIGFGVVLLPSAQVLVGWASAWPQALTLLLAAAGFSAIETEIERGGMKRVIALLGGCMIYAAASLIYQANVLFALVIVTAVLLVRTGREPLSDVWWCTFHVAAVVVGLLVGHLIMSLLFSNGVFHREEVLTGSFLHFLRYPVPNSFALFALNDDEFTGVILYWLTALVVATALVLAYRKMAASADKMVRRRALYAVSALGIITLLVCFIASDRITTYRVLFSIAGLLLVLMTYSLRTLVVREKLRWKHYTGLAVLSLFLTVLAYRNSYQLLAQPQAVEWELMRTAVLRASFTKPVRVHIITAALSDRTTERTYGDEFGTVSSDDPEIAKNMFRVALAERFPEKLPKGGSYVVAASDTVPAAGSFDLLIDMRKIKPAGL